jgi:hypothetical protein
VLIILAEQHRWQIPEKESGKQYAFCFYAVGKSTVFFRWRLFETGTKFTEDEGFYSLLKTVRCFGVWLKQSYFNFILEGEL